MSEKRLSINMQESDYQMIQELAQTNYLKVSTYAKQVLLKHVAQTNKIDVKPFNHEAE